MNCRLWHRDQRNTGEFPLESNACLPCLRNTCTPSTPTLLVLHGPGLLFYLFGGPRMIEHIFGTALDRPDNWHYEGSLSRVTRLIFLSPLQQSISSFYGSYCVYCLKIASCREFLNDENINQAKNPIKINQGLV